MAEPDVTRRDFLKLGVAAGATAALGDLAVGQQSGDQLRCGFIGVGGRGTALLDQTLGFDDVALLAVCDINPDRLTNATGMVLKRQGRKPHLYGEDGDKHAYRRLLARKDLDAVVLATPCNWHAPMYLDTIAAGKNFYGEKPMCISVKEANDIVAAAEAAPKLVAQIGFQRRANPHYVESIRLIQQGEIGELLEARVAWANAWGPLRGWFSHRAESGDWVIEQACHTWDVMNWVTGATPLRAYAAARTDIYNADEPGRDVADYYAAIIEYPKRFTVSAFHSWICPNDGEFTGVYENVVARQGGCDLGGGRFIYRDQAKPKREVGQDVNDTRESLRSFFDSVKAGKPPVSGVYNGRDAVFVGLMIRKSYDAKRVVTWDDLLRSA
jgi:myo-inositol 2-dehydrogenase/D-chiro-inositol 1-dehydrogenase